MRFKPTLTWERIGDGVYRSGPFTITRQPRALHTTYGRRGKGSAFYCAWLPTHTDGRIMLYRRTMGDAQWACEYEPIVYGAEGKRA